MFVRQSGTFVETKQLDRVSFAKYCRSAAQIVDNLVIAAAAAP